MFLLDWILALFPIAFVLTLMVGLRWGGVRAGVAGWVAALVIAALRFGAGPDVLLWAQVRGLFYTLFVLYIIWPALLFYRVTDEAGAVAAVGRGLPHLTSDRALQALILGWVFSTFLQGVGGFGVPVAVLAPLLVGLGFPVVPAVVIPSIGHSWSVTFGSLGASFYALMAVTGRPGEELGPPSALLLGLACYLCGAGVLWAAGGPRALRHGLLPLLLIGTAMAGTQYLVVRAEMWPIGGMCAGLAGISVSVLWARRRRNRDVHRETGPSVGWALVPYLILVGIVLVAELVPPVESFLNEVVIRVRVPELVTARGWRTPEGFTTAISIFGHAGALLIYASGVTFGLYARQRRYKPGVLKRIGRDVVRRALPASVGIAAMVGMAVTMEHAGMTYLLAEGIAGAVGRMFLLASPFIGALGAFMTGSNANSNVVFGAFQQQAALLAGLDPVLALAAQTAGGAVGSMFAPAKVIVGCATVGADESPTMRKSMVYGTVILAVLAVVTFSVGWWRWRYGP
ncbi:MAG: L-lactate permease [Anaerolineae bacterium]|nr:L-lactate permease [Anaerolineae bacterium]MDW7992052.1 L-lactate permease [Anaerolineae bacterium]